MTVYNTAYDTTACNNSRGLAKIVNAIQEARFRDYLPVADGIVYVESTSAASNEIQAFKHALYISKHHSTEIQHSNEMKLEPYLAMDVRAAGRYNRGIGSGDMVAADSFKITNSTLYKNLVLRAALTGLWLSNGPNAFRSITPTAMAVYASWISETVSFRYSLDPQAKIELMILAAIFYTSNHVEGIEFDKAGEGRYLSSIANALRVGVADVARIYDVTKVIGSLEEFCVKTKAFLGNVRLENLSAGIMVALMGGTWGGDNAPELTAVALEHPPTWISLLFEAYTNTAMRKVGLSKICERRQYQDGLSKLAMVIKTLAPESVGLLGQQSIAF